MAQFADSSHRVKTTCDPSGEKLGKFSAKESSASNTCWLLPSSFISHSWEFDTASGIAPKTSCRPSGDQVAQQVPPPLALKKVSCVTSVPSGFIVKTSPFEPVKAILPFLPPKVALAGIDKASSRSKTPRLPRAHVL